MMEALLGLPEGVTVEVDEDVRPARGSLAAGALEPAARATASPETDAPGRGSMARARRVLRPRLRAGPGLALG